MQGIFSDLVASFIWLLMGILVTMVFRGLTLIPSMRQRIKLFRFLGINKDRPEFRVYLSTVFVQPGGSVDSKGTPRTYAGPATPGNELAVIQPLTNLFHSRALGNLSAPMRRWLGAKVHWAFQGIYPLVSPSPEKTSQVEPTNTLVVGSEYYNTAGELYMETGDPFLEMPENSETIRVRKGPRSGDVFRRRPNHIDDVAILEKLLDEVRGTTIFLAAGLGVVGTRGAVQYLIDDWATLQKDFGDKPFAVCLRFQDIAKDPGAYQKPVKLADFS